MVTKKHDLQLKPNFREIILPAQKGARAPGVAESFAYEPTTVAEEPLGYLFFMGEIVDETPGTAQKSGAPAPMRKRQDWGHLLNLIASLMKREYYAVGERGVHAALESALRKANAAIAELGPRPARPGMSHAPKSPWANHLHGVVAALSRSTFHFATTGDVALYIKRGKHLMDVAATLVKSGSRANRAFRTIASGRVMPGDTIVMTSSRAAAAFSESEHDPFVRLPAFDGITAHLTTLLRKANAGPAAVLAMELTAVPEQKMSITSYQLPVTNYQSPVTNYQLPVTNYQLPVTNYQLPVVAAAPDASDAPAPVALPESAARLTTPSHTLPLEVPVTSNRLPEEAEGWSGGDPAESDSAPDIQSRFDGWTHAARQALRWALKPRRIAVVLAGVLILWGVSNASRIFGKHPTSGSSRTLQEARAKRDGAEHALLKGRNEEAAALLTQALAALEGALRDPTTRRDAEALAADVASLRAKAERVEAVAEPPVFFDASSLAVTFAADGAVLGKNAVVFFSSTSNILVRLDPARAAATAIFANLDVGEGMLAATAFNDSIVFLTTKGRFITYAPASDRSAAVLGPAPANARDLASFGTNLYVLTADAPYLLKAPVRDGVLQPAKPWLTTTEPVAAARLAIDGAIWVAESASQLTRFYQGKLAQRFTLAGISTGTIQDLETDEDHDVLAIATTDPGRVIIAGKDGTVITQLASPAFQNVRGLTFFNESLLVVTPQKTYRVELPQTP